MRLTKAILLRLLYGILSLLFITFVSFIADELAPGDAATVRAGEKATLPQIQQLRHDMGLDRPWEVRYVESLGKMAHGDFGNSYYGVQEPVVDIIKRTLPITMKFAILAIILASGIGILFGTIAAIYQNRFVDRSVLTLGTLGVTIPNFVLGPLLVILFTKVLNDYLYGSFGFGIADSYQSTNGKPADWTVYVLPVIVLASRPAAMLTRLTRASMIETMQQEFIRMATAKGVPFWRLIIRHALRNAILPVITAIGTSFGFLLTGSFVTERFFLIPGLGQETIAAILQTNAPVFTGCIIVTGMLFLIVNLIVDLLLPLLDPRIREAQVSKRRKDPLLIVGLLFLGGLLLLAIISPYVCQDPFKTGQPFQPASGSHWFGTDELGRDIFARIAYGARVSLLIGFVVQISALITGIVMGTLGVFSPKWIRNIVNRFTDGMFAFPDILLAMLIIGFWSAKKFTGSGFLAEFMNLLPVMVALAITAWPGLARLVGTQLASLKDREYVVAARASGATTFYIVTRHVLPQLWGILIAVTMVELAGTILAESTLSFLGIGVQAPIPSWGSMINNARTDMSSHPILLLWPCAVLSLTIFALNFVGDGLRARFDPKSNSSYSSVLSW